MPVNGAGVPGMFDYLSGVGDCRTTSSRRHRCRGDVVPSDLKHIFTVAVLSAVTATSCSSSIPATDPTAARAPIVAFVESGGVRIRVHSVGPAKARETLVVIHGGPGLSLESLENLDVLAGPDRRVVSYDQRGAGQSSKPDDSDYRLDAQLSDLEAVRKWTGAGKVDVLGQSWGGLLASAYTALHPDRVRSLVLLDAAPLDWTEFLAGQQRFAARETQLRAEGVVAATLPPDEGDSCLPGLLARIPVYLARPDGPAPPLHTTCTTSATLATFAAVRTSIGQAQLTQLADRLADYRGRALVIMGREDPFGLGWLERCVHLLEGARVEQLIVAGSGHLSSLERPEVVIPAIDIWLHAGAAS